MPAKSKKQQQYFGMVEAGKIPAPKGIKPKAVKEFASTSTHGLPEHAQQMPAHHRTKTKAT